MRGGVDRIDGQSFAGQGVYESWGTISYFCDHLPLGGSSSDCGLRILKSGERVTALLLESVAQTTARAFPVWVHINFVSRLSVLMRIMPESLFSFR